ncbi:MAG: hypothetical protein L0226_16380 [Acidobacteria bacterium]|nr:hypothetical protein [Acidobacteriota bacterium]
MSKNEVFLDTSIQIARAIHSRKTKEWIKSRIENYSGTVTSLIVRQEYKRRFLKEAAYLLNLFNEKQSFAKVQRHVTDRLTFRHQRKQKINLETLTTILEGSSDDDLTERSVRYLRALLRLGLSEFDAGVDEIIDDSGCACAKLPIIEDEPYKRYRFGTDKCSKTLGACGIIEFIKVRKYDLYRVQNKLRSLNEKTDELRRAEEFIQKVLDGPDAANSYNPCLKFGDLIIALESVNVSVFYTLNGKESQHFCRALNQNLVVRPTNDDLEDEVCLIGDEEWKKF